MASGVSAASKWVAVIGALTWAAPAVAGPLAVSAEIGVEGPSGQAFFGPSVATSGTVFLEVWSDGRSGSSGVWAQRFDASGALDAAAFALDVSGNAHSAVVAWDGAQFVVAWWSSGAIRVARVSAAGTVLDPGGLVVESPTDAMPSIASDGTQTWIGWAHYLSPDHHTGVVARFSRAGALLDSPPIELVAEPGGVLDRVCFDGTQVWFAWLQQLNVMLPIELRASRVSTAGVVLDPGGLVLKSAGNGFEARLVSGPGCLALTRTTGGQLDLVRLPVVGNSVAAATVASDAVDPAGAFDGLNWLITWFSTSGELRASRFSSQGTARDTAPRLLDVSASYGLHAVGHGEGRTRLVYARHWEDPPGSGTYSGRVFAVEVQEQSDLALAQGCTDDFDCASGYCVDSVCCDARCGAGLAHDCQACSIAAGAAADGVCGPTLGDSCDDDKLCTFDDVCGASGCAGTPTSCMAASECLGASYCQWSDGQCAPQVAAPNGTPCTGGTCRAGLCVPAPPEEPPEAPAPKRCGCSVGWDGSGLAWIGLIPALRRRRSATA
jgi:hypothetical protein